MKKKVYIEGMSCNNCVRHVHEALIQIDGVQDAQVSLEKSVQK
ncbi:heavy-metal-associated domain-containing protein [Thermoclostridium stercorarium]